MAARYCNMPERELPVICDADIIIAGATLGSISAALKAADMGAKVFVISYMPYMGEDICGTYKYLFEEQEGSHPLLAEIFPEDKDRTPFNVKKALENELVDRNVDFLYSSYVTDVLFNEEQQPAGVVIANRSGQQIIRGKVIIDATQGAYVAKMAGACFQEENSDVHQFQFIAIGNSSDAGGRRRLLPISPKCGEKTYAANEYTFSCQLNDWTFPSLCNLEQDIREMTWDADQVDSADTLFYIPPFKIQGLQSYTDKVLDPDTLPVEAFKPKNIKHMYVLGSCADISRSAVADLLKPANIVSAGEKIGKSAFEEAKSIKPSSNITIKTKNESAAVKGVLSIAASRPELGDNNKLRLNSTVIPVIGDYEVAVIGGGTVGANAGISAARNGARTLVVEYLHALGGTQTMGRIGVYWDGFREGFVKEIDQGVREMAAADHPRQLNKDGHFNCDWKAEWYRKEIRKAKGDIWFGAFGIGAFVEEGVVKGVLLSTPQGMGVVLAKIVIDSTGSGDIAIAAGAEYDYTDGEVLAIQGGGLPAVNPGDYYNNTDWTFVDDSDVFDVTRLYISAKAMYNDVYDIGKLPQTRERRRVKADHMVSVLDIINHRRYSDTISYHRSSFDTHGYTIDPLFTILPPEKRHVIYDADVPLASLLPRGLNNILVTGLGIGAHRDAMPVLRMQPCLQNQGYSVGYLSAQCIKDNCSVRDVDIKKVQAHLVEKGILPERVLTDTDSFPIPDEKFKEAVERLPQEFNGLQVLLTDPKKAEELIYEAFLQSRKDSEKTVYAQVLCMLGNATGLQFVIDSVEAYPDWDEGWHYTGMGQFGPCMSRLDSLIIALGESRQESALPCILKKAKLLLPDHAFSHFRAVALACEKIGSPAAAPVLAGLLDMEGITGNHVGNFKQARNNAVPDKEDVTLRNRELKEIYLARALYRCGDYNDKARRILENYSRSLNVHYRRHAAGILRYSSADK